MFSLIQMKLKNGFLLFFLLLESVCFNVESKCMKGCDLALASYFVYPQINIQKITNFMQSSVLSNSDVIESYNKDKVFHGLVISLQRINVPFPCDCIGGEFLGHVFEYSAVEGDTYDLITNMRYPDLTTVELLHKYNSYDPNHIPVNAKVNVTVKCYCGNSQISKDYGLFITYPLDPSDTLKKIVNETSLDAKLLQSYNPGVNFSQGSGIVFIPGRGMIWFSPSPLCVLNSDTSKYYLVYNYQRVAQCTRKEGRCMQLDVNSSKPSHYGLLKFQHCTNSQLID